MLLSVNNFSIVSDESAIKILHRLTDDCKLHVNCRLLENSYISFIKLAILSDFFGVFLFSIYTMFG